MPRPCRRSRNPRPCHQVRCRAHNREKCGVALIIEKGLPDHGINVAIKPIEKAGLRSLAECQVNSGYGALDRAHRLVMRWDPDLSHDSSCRAHAWSGRLGPEGYLIKMGEARIRCGKAAIFGVGSCQRLAHPGESLILRLHVGHEPLPAGATDTGGLANEGQDIIGNPPADLQIP